MGRRGETKGVVINVKMFVIRPTKSTVVNFPHNSDLMLKLSSIGLRAKRSDNFIPRVMRKRLRANFHNFDHNFAAPVSSRPFFNVQFVTGCRPRRPPAAREWLLPTCASHDGVDGRRCAFFSRARAP